MYHDIKSSNERIAEIRREYTEKGYENITVWRAGERIHIQAYDPKRKRDINCYAIPNPL
ncbi:hypothetical protein FDI85_gp249 [Erwinia phage Machina]|uniref:Uncharacterized protein n=2 Tax=Machinavirus machina TaxID=2169990 RepID=A0A1B2ICX6_9CAUD|nr:hypothetical protein BIZ81_gp247 [Erwinia phage vB_EamM_Huxley]YP_009616952.1 hypothetical protein FDI85_gp249 [Erwinia phage Machina]ANZ49946.1 hypothetical protein PARSHIK_37 [Erwinia phage vB_EamM_Parshik]QOC54486.1 hypothetical protein pSALSNUABM04_026 [Salmonella phage pSal-SNUABM-04]ANZ49118.1 hypothetical protein HUXLEY_36 [Erwinia phage vB_EamM_Huxley]ANZ49673.1 hypothetical protein MACHINA_35 [Erwinia phage Machina]